MMTLRLTEEESGIGRIKYLSLHILTMLTFAGDGTKSFGEKAKVIHTLE